MNSPCTLLPLVYQVLSVVVCEHVWHVCSMCELCVYMPGVVLLLDMFWDWPLGEVGKSSFHVLVMPFLMCLAPHGCCIPLKLTDLIADYFRLSQEMFVCCHTG